MNVKPGDFVKVRYDGQACGSFGVPKNCHGRKAKVIKVGRTRLKVIIDGDPCPREVSMTSCRKAKSR